jgi:hypothetical protein
MSCKLLCATCGEKYDEGRYGLTPSAQVGPAEYVRVVKGPARAPLPELMDIKVDNVIFQSQAYYVCDSCEGDIEPGSPATTVTLWIGGLFSSNEPLPWEKTFIEQEVPMEKRREPRDTSKRPSNHRRVGGAFQYLIEDPTRITPIKRTELETYVAAAENVSIPLHRRLADGALPSQSDRIEMWVSDSSHPDKYWLHWNRPCDLGQFWTEVRRLQGLEQGGRQ